MELTAHFILERETKGAVRYAEVDSDAKPVEVADSVIGTLYIRKSAIKGTIPTALAVTVKSVS